MGHVSESLTPALRVDIPVGCAAANRLGDFDIEQMRGVKRQSRLEQTPLQGCRRWNPEGYFDYN
jgi:hypothetical protein